VAAPTGAVEPSTGIVVTPPLSLEEAERPAAERRVSALVGERLGGQADMSAIGWESRRPWPLAETSEFSQIETFARVKIRMAQGLESTRIRHPNPTLRMSVSGSQSRHSRRTDHGAPQRLAPMTAFGRQCGRFLSVGVRTGPSQSATFEESATTPS